MKATWAATVPGSHSSSYMSSGNESYFSSLELPHILGEVRVAVLRVLSFEKPVDKLGPWLPSWNLDFRMVPDIPDKRAHCVSIIYMQTLPLILATYVPSRSLGF